MITKACAFALYSDQNNLKINTIAIWRYGVELATSFECEHFEAPKTTMKIFHNALEQGGFVPMNLADIEAEEERRTSASMIEVGLPG